MDEHPDSADIEALDHHQAYCPACGAEVWDDAGHCPACGEWFSAPAVRPPAAKRSRNVFQQIMLVLALIGFIIIFLLSMPW